MSRSAHKPVPLESSITVLPGCIGYSDLLSARLVLIFRKSVLSCWWKSESQERISPVFPWSQLV